MLTERSQVTEHDRDHDCESTDIMRNNWPVPLSRFYVPIDVDRATDQGRIACNTCSIIENRPALSRWHPDHAPDFDAFMAAD